MVESPYIRLSRRRLRTKRRTARACGQPRRFLRAVSSPLVLVSRGAGYRLGRRSSWIGRSLRHGGLPGLGFSSEQNILEHFAFLVCNGEPLVAVALDTLLVEVVVEGQSLADHVALGGGLLLSQLFEDLVALFGELDGELTLFD